MKKPIYVETAAALLAAAMLCGCSRETPKEAPGQKPTAAEKSAQPPKPRYDPREAAKRAAKIRAAMKAEEETDTPMTEADLALLNEIQAALNEEDKDKVFALVAKVNAAKPHSDTRRAMVRALGWFGTDALDPLLAFAKDDDVRTATDAHELIATTIDNFEQDRPKADAIIKAMNALKDESTLDELATLIASLPRPLAMEAIIAVAEGGNAAAAAKAREAYTFMTDEKFSGRAAAVKWLKANLLDGEDIAELVKKFPAE